MTRVALVTCLRLPEPDLDEALLVAALRDAGVEAEVRAWDDDGVRWEGYDLAVIRSTWNYHLHRARFVAWAERIATRTRLLNPLPVLVWNTHKRYLADLEQRGVAIVPTLFVAAGESRDLAELDAPWGRNGLVIKPAVSAGSYATERFPPGERAAAAAHLRRLVAGGDVMVQPYLRSVEGPGERALVCIDGHLTHAVRKAPRLSADQESVSGAIGISGEERACADQVLAAVPFTVRLLYARVDVARDDEGRFCLMELELTEPSLFLAQHPPALARFAAAIVTAAAAAGR